MTQSTDIGTAVWRSPIQDWLEAHGAQQRIIGGVSFTVSLRTDAAEQVVRDLLGICDLSGLRKFGVKGRDAESWLHKANLPLPGRIFESLPLADGSLIVRLGSSEFFFESAIRSDSDSSIVPPLLPLEMRVFPVHHEEATFLITGSNALALLSQTCGINFRDAIPRLAVFTRVAGVNCCVLPDMIGRLPTYRIWVDPGYALYLWETLIEIGESLGGAAIGAGCLFPELLS